MGADRGIIWFTGHSGSGKTTLSRLVYKKLKEQRDNVFLIDSDTVPVSIIKPKGDSWQERQQYKNENIVFMAKLLYDHGYLVMIASVGRLRSWRDRLGELAAPFWEVYMRCPLDLRLERDRAGKYARNTDYYDMYEEPLMPALVLDTDRMTTEECVNRVLAMIGDLAQTS